MELEPRTTAPAHATGAVAFVPLAAVADDATFRLRGEGDVAALAGSIGRLGQLVPVELRLLPGAEGGAPRYQVVAGFRRLAALRMLMRERVLARVHQSLSDEDAWGLALGQVLLTEPLDRAGLEQLRTRLEETGIAPWAGELVDDALVSAPVEPELRERFFEFLAGGEPVNEQESEGAVEADSGSDTDTGTGTGTGTGVDAGEEELEVTPEELVADLSTRLYEVNADLAVAIESWSDLPPEGRRAIAEQARWIAEVLPLLEQDGEEER